MPFAPFQPPKPAPGGPATVFPGAENKNWQRLLWTDKHRRGSLAYARDRLFDSAPQALCHATFLTAFNRDGAFSTTTASGQQQKIE